MKLAICQINTITADLEGNVQRCQDAIQPILSQNPDLIILPEMSICGPFPMDIFLDKSFVEALQAAQQDFAWINRHNSPILFGSVIPAKDQRQSQPKLTNCALLAKDGILDIVSQQQELCDHDIHYDSRWFNAGEIVKIIHLNSTKILPLIGKDITNYSALRFPNDLDPPDLIIALHNTVFTHQAEEEKRQYLKTLPAPTIWINQVGGHDGLVLEGQSCLFDPKTQKGITLQKFKTDTICVSFPNPTYVKQQTNDVEADWLEVICLGIQDFFRKNDIRRAFVGISGGIDSAVITYVAQRALGPKNITALSLPSRYNDPRSVTYSQDLCNKLHVNFEVVSIESMFSLFEKELSGLIRKEVVAENIQARIRSLILMAYVNFHGGVLLNTSNKTELSLGYGTLYGDLAGTLAPIGDLTKPEVYQLARWINRTEEIIPAFILSRKPSAELRLNQVDPFDYPVISPQIEDLIQNNQSSPSMRQAEHKRRQFGTIIKLSKKSLGDGRLIPITRK